MPLNNNNDYPHSVLFPELTHRESKILHLYATGSTQQNIALSCDIAEVTVKKQMSEMRDKFNCGSSSELRQIYLCRILTPILNLALNS
ncbi:helix-turn-helix transcriptional regulator [Vibrio mediterranei]|jgi:DNA-binding NarL/FixJ family response regulator|uniref:helix-turn-helix transcriptional regulator n=1 Tax=Vibrio TaxID=662 RepID=UPI0004DD57BF|nr:hypothetical protein HW45_18990 [Vibrio sp. ER1A]